MKRRLEIALLSLFLLAGIAAVFLTRGRDVEQPGSVVRLEPKAGAVLGDSITVRNVTKGPVSFGVKPYDSEGVQEKRSLAAGALAKIESETVMVAFYERAGREVWKLLTPGKPYSFRHDENDLLELYPGSHGRSDAEDLAPYVPTPKAVVDKMLDMAGLGPDDVLYDIGCGDGRIVVAAALRFRTRGVGIDIDPERIRESRENAAKAGVNKLVRFLEEDATKTDISPATVVTLYLLPESNELLRPKLEKELEPGTRVLSHNYKIPGWESKRVESAIVVDSLNKKHELFLYRR